MKDASGQKTLHSQVVHKVAKDSQEDRIGDGIYNLTIIVSALSIFRFLVEDYNEFGWIMSVPLSEIRPNDYLWFMVVMAIIATRSLCFYKGVCAGLHFAYFVLLVVLSEIIVLYINIVHIRYTYLSGWSLVLNIVYIAKIVSFYLFHYEAQFRKRTNDNFSNNDVATGNVSNSDNTFTKDDTVGNVKKRNDEKEDVANINNASTKQSNISTQVHEKGGCKVAHNDDRLLCDTGEQALLDSLNDKVINLHSFLYFLVAPTLCYQSTYPMRTRRSYRKICCKIMSFTLGLFLFVFVSDQYAVPSIYRIIAQKQYLIVLENAINLALSTAFLFLIFFHLVFVCGLDILAELTRFQDNEFYQSWWNSKTVSEFWMLWNTPVHKWFKRHVYKPFRAHNRSKLFSQFVCFFISALAHEYVVSVSSKKTTGLVFFGMILQVPLIYATETFSKMFPKMANYFFWCSFCIIGQPTFVLLYYRSQHLRQAWRTNFLMC